MSGKRGRRPVEQTVVESKIGGWRVFRGMTQEAVAEHAGMSVSTYWKYEKGRIVNPGILQLSRIAFVLGCDLDDIIEPEWRPDYTPPGALPRPDPSDWWPTDYVPPDG